MIGERLLPRFNFLFVGGVWPSPRRSGQFCCRFFCAQLAPADGARVGRRDYISRKGSSAASLPDCDRKFERVTPTSSNAFRRREYRPDQIEGDLMQLLPRLDRHLHRPATSGYFKVGPFDLHRDGPAMSVRFLAPGPDIVSHRDHAGLDLNGIYQVLRESRLRPRRLSFPVRLNQPVVPTSCDVVVPAPRLAEVLLQKRKSLPSQVRARLDAKGAHLNGHLWAHAVELRDR